VCGKCLSDQGKETTYKGKRHGRGATVGGGRGGAGVGAGAKCWSLGGPSQPTSRGPVTVDPSGVFVVHKFANVEVADRGKHQISKKKLPEEKRDVSGYDGGSGNRETEGRKGGKDPL